MDILMDRYDEMVVIFFTVTGVGMALALLTAGGLKVYRHFRGGF